MNLLFARAVELFVPKGLVSNVSWYCRYQLFIAVSMALLGVIVSAQSYSIFVSALSMSDVEWTLIFTVPLQLTLIVAPLYFRASGNYHLAVNFVLAVMFIILAGVVCYLGALLGGVSVVMIFVLPMFAFILLG
jgi:hypothetical protein